LRKGNCVVPQFAITTKCVSFFRDTRHDFVSLQVTYNPTALLRNVRFDKELHIYQLRKIYAPTLQQSHYT